MKTEGVGEGAVNDHLNIILKMLAPVPLPLPLPLSTIRYKCPFPLATISFVAFPGKNLKVTGGSGWFNCYSNGFTKTALTLCKVLKSYR